MIRFILLLCVIVLASCEPKNINTGVKMTQSQKSSGSVFENQVDSLRIQYKIPGLSIAISINDSIQLIRGFGLANIEEGVPMTGDTPMRIASLTKPIFSTILMQLVEEGKIDLNWRIKDYYPNYIRKCKRIKRYLKNEMPRYSFLMDAYYPGRDDILLKHHLTHTAENTPGVSYKYNGLLFGMLSDVVEEATDLTFDQWVDSLIIQKLNLKHSASSQLDKSKLKVLNEIALPYTVDTAGYFKKSEFPNLALNAGAGLIFSARDLLLFDRAFNNNIVISSESKEKALAPFELADRSFSPYGYGWFIQKYRGHTLIWHYGLQPNAYSGLYLKVLEKDLTMVILANSQNLSQPFDLGKGNVLNSKFTMVFLDEFLNKQTKG